MKRRIRIHITRTTLSLKLSVVLVICILILLFTGCASLKEGRAILDDQLEQVMACIAANDKAAMAELAYDSQYALGLFNSFDELAAFWPANTDDFYYNQSLNISVTNGERSYWGEYIVRSAEKLYTVSISYQQDEAGAGITALRAEPGTAPFSLGTPTGTLKTAGENSLTQWLFLLFWLVSLGFTVFTIIDIAKKKPQYYVLWLLVAIAFASVNLSYSATSFNLSWSVTILGTSQWLQYPNGANVFVFGFPIGAVTYWCMRNKLLRQKAAAQPQSQPNVFAVPLEPAPSESQPERTEETTE